MNIGINILYLTPGKVGGTETYARGLISAYLEANTNDVFYLFCNEETAQTLTLHPRVHIIRIPLSGSGRLLRVVAEQVILPIYLVRMKIDVLHSLGYTTPIISPCPTVLTIHDLNWYYHPEDFSLHELVAWKILVTSSIKSATKIVTVSEASRQSLLDILNVRKSKVKAILSGIPMPITCAEETQDSLKIIPKRYLFSVLASYPHKNLLNALKAFKIVRKQFPDLQYIICGLGGKASTNIEEYISSNNLKDSVHVLGYVSDQLLRKLYQNSQLFVFPSAYEGFGFPVLEALQYDIPVVSSNKFSLKELVLDERALFDPFDIAQIAFRISNILSDPKLAKSILRTEKRILSQLSWSKTAQDMLKYIHSVQTKRRSI